MKNLKVFNIKSVSCQQNISFLLLSPFHCKSLRQGRMLTISSFILTPLFDFCLLTTIFNFNMFFFIRRKYLHSFFILRLQSWWMCFLGFSFFTLYAYHFSPENIYTWNISIMSTFLFHKMEWNEVRDIKHNQPLFATNLDDFKGLIQNHDKLGNIAWVRSINDSK